MSTENTYKEATSEDALVEPVWSLLVKAREGRGLSIKEVASHLKIKESYVVALETGDYSQLPCLTFVRGYVKNYAKLVGVDVDFLLAEIPDDGVKIVEGKPVGGLASLPRKKRYVAMRFAITFGCMVFTAVVSYYFWTHKHSDVDIYASLEAVMSAQLSDDLTPSDTDADLAVDNILQQTSTSVPLPQISEAHADLPVSDTVLHISFKDDCWIEVKSLQDTVLKSGVEKAGTELTLTVPANVSLRLGNAPGVEKIMFGGQAVTLPAGAKLRKVAKLTLTSPEQS